jgi:hypothetical protein
MKHISSFVPHRLQTCGLDCKLLVLQVVCLMVLQVVCLMVLQVVCLVVLQVVCLVVLQVVCLLVLQVVCCESERAERRVEGFV